MIEAIIEVDKAFNLTLILGMLIPYFFVVYGVHRLNREVEEVLEEKE